MQKEDIIEAIEGLQIQDDFTDFMEYIASNKVKLTGTGRLGFKDCFNINQKLFHSIAATSNKTAMNKYPAILFCFYVGQAAGIVRKHKEKSNTFLVIDEEIFEYFKSFNKVEQYFALLNNFWLNTQPDELTGEDRANNSVEDINQFLTNSYLHNFKLKSYKEYSLYFWHISQIIRQFSFLGWLEFEEKKEGYAASRKIIEKVKFNNIGKVLVKILCEERPLLYWNKFARLGQSYLFEVIFMSMRDVKEDVSEEEIEANLKKAKNEVFEVPFQTIIGDTLENIWKTNQSSAQVKGNFIFKVLLSNKIWRRITISSNATFEDLHLIIQEAFKFDNDHLYAFYPSGKLYSGVSINSPWGQEPPFTDEIKLNEMELMPGTDMLYLFDFGDNWEFKIHFEKNIDEKPLKKPKIIESKGDAPKQYRYWDEEEEDY